MMTYNFSPGPAMLPEPVMQQVQEEVMDFQGLGAGAFEISHTTPQFKAVLEECGGLLRELLHVPPEYKVLFAHGGAQLQFSMVPLNLLPLKPWGLSAHVDTGLFAQRALEEAARYGAVQLLASGRGNDYTAIPTVDWGALDKRVSYLHITTNNTVPGTSWREIPQPAGLTLVGDATSDLLARELDVSRFGVLYAGIQKNLGPPGLAVVIIHEALLGQAFAYTPRLLNYSTLAEFNSLANTTHTFAIYVMHKVLRWTVEQGGVEALAARNGEKAHLVYETIDRSGFYRGFAEPPSRSTVNVTFTVSDEALNGTFLAEAAQAGLQSLKGHRARGGMRASLYNAMPTEGAKTLAAFMAEFERKHG